MNKNIEKLSGIASKKERMIIGLMSGTSLDGLDIALCRINGTGFSTKVTIEKFETVPYEVSFKNGLKEICFRAEISLRKLTLLHKNIAELHGQMINSFLQKNNISADDIDLIASHGQTVYHAPLSLHRNADYGNATLQIGDGDHIAVKTNIITVSDFRQKNIAAGGEGAPLAVYGDIILFSEKEKDVLLLNIGGISNFTFIPAAGGIVCTDLGPGNTLMDQWMQLNFPGKEHDENAEIAKKGTVNDALLKAFREHKFFTAPFPKTTGPELFNRDFISNALFDTGLDNLNAEDIMATLNKLTADIICDGINNLSRDNSLRIYVSGGGSHNPLLMQHLKEGIVNAEIFSTEVKGINPDAKEAVLFALLANECIGGEAATFSGPATKVPAISMGKISFPY